MTIDPHQYIPNKINLKLRIFSLALSLVLLGGITYGLAYQHLILPYGRGARGGMMEFNGYEVTLPIFSLLLLAIGFIALIVDHFDKRNNEYTYKKIINYSIGIGLCVYFASIMFAGHKVA